MRTEINYLNNKERLKNIIFFNIEDTKEVNESLTAYVTNLLDSIGVNLTEADIQEFVPVRITR